MQRALVLSALVILGSTAAIPRASACSCAPQTIEEAIASSAAIFEGRVVSIEPIEGGGGRGAVRVRLDVVQTWREANTEHVEVTTSASDASCGYPFAVEQSYLVYASVEEDGGMHVSLCSRTRPMDDADEDRAALGSGAIPVDVVDEPGDGEAGSETEAAEAQPRGQVARRGGGCAGCSIGGGNGAPALAVLALVGLALARRRDR